LNGLPVTTTAPPKDFELVKDLGADNLKVFDHNKVVVERIRTATGNALDVAIDSISKGKTT
jgi:NADPH:quinone reductase-like Zn-dependent oxidoreductase